MLAIVTTSKLKNEWTKYWSQKSANEQTHVWYADSIGKRLNEQTLWKYEKAILSLIGAKKSGASWFATVKLIKAAAIWWKFDSVWTDFEILLWISLRLLEYKNIK